jgi:disulfide bond formation protein DsbB
MNSQRKRIDIVLITIAMVSVAAVAVALVSQHVFNIDPCPWCILQRVIFLAIALAAVLGLAWRSAAGRMAGSGLAALLALSGIAAALWQHFQAAASQSCKLTLADNIVSAMKLDTLMPDVFLARASCADAAVKVLGVPYEFYSLALFVLIGVAAWRVLRAR